MSKFNCLVLVFLGVPLLSNVTSATEQLLQQYEDLSEECKELLKQFSTIKLTKHDLPPQIQRKICCCACCCDRAYGDEEVLERLLQISVSPNEVIKNSETIKYSKPFTDSDDEQKKKDKNTVKNDVIRTHFPENEKKYQDILHNLLDTFVDEGYSYFQGFNFIFAVAILLTSQENHCCDEQQAKEIAYKILFSKEIHLYTTINFYLGKNAAFRECYDRAIHELIANDNIDWLFCSFVIGQILNPLCFVTKSQEICFRIINLLFKYGYNINNNIIKYFWNRLAQHSKLTTSEVENNIATLCGITG